MGTRRSLGRPPAPLRRGRPSAAGRRADQRKLNGQYFTPLDLARRIVTRLRWPRGGGTFLDPACGDGVFLEAALEKAAGATTPSKHPPPRIIGWDIDPAALAAARRRLEAACLRLAVPSAWMPRLEHRDALDARAEGVAVIAGNPPYLEAKRMPDPLKARIRGRWPLAARGAFDLYGAFVALCLESEPSELALVLPNRFLVTAATAPLRTALLEAYTAEVLDLSRERLFHGAAVYPVVISARRRRTNRGKPVDPEAPLPILPRAPAGRRFVRRLLEAADLPRLGDRLDLRWSVSFHRAGLRDRFVFSEPREDRPCLRPFLGGPRFFGNREVQPCRIVWAGTWIDYDEARARAEGNPLPPARLFEPPRLVVCQNARRLRCAVDTEGYALKDTFLCGQPRRGGARSLRWLALYLQSDLLHYLYEHLYGGTRKAGGHLHFLPRTLTGLPLPPMPVPRCTDTLYRRAAGGDTSAFTKIETLVRQAFACTPAERRALDAYAYPPRE